MEEMTYKEFRKWFVSTKKGMDNNTVIACLDIINDVEKHRFGREGIWVSKYQEAALENIVSPVNKYNELKRLENFRLIREYYRERIARMEEDENIVDQEHKEKEKKD